MPLILPLLTLLAAPQRGDVIFATDFESPDAAAGWSAPAQLGPGYQSDHALFVDRSIIQRELPIDALRGCLVHFAAMVRGESISDKPQPWNGVKFMVIVDTPRGKQYPQGAIGTGTFDWQRVVFAYRIPDDATSATLVLGMEAVTGRVWFDDLRFTVRKPPFVPVPRQSDGPPYRGTTVPRLRGAMVSPNIDAEGLRTFGVDWHANVIRWQLVGWRPQGDRLDLDAYQAWLDSQLTKLDAALPLCRQHGLLVVVDLHSGPSGPAASGEDLFNSQACQDKFIQVWQQMASRYQDSPVVWGYDLLNEPIEGAVSETLLDWSELADQAAHAVRAIDPDHAIIVEPPEGGGPNGFVKFQPVDVPGVVYSVHMYLPHAFTHQGVLGDKSLRYVYPGEIGGKLWDKAALEAALQPAVEFQKLYGVQIYVGEFSAIRWAPDDSAYRYLRDVIDIFETHGWDWTYHAFREWPGWSVEHSSDEADNQRTAEPNTRQTLLRGWLAENEKPEF